MTATEQSIELARAAARAASDKLAQDVTAIDVSERLAITDIFFIASAATERQVNAIADGIEDELHKFDLRPVRREGRSSGRWVLLDYADIVFHIQHEEDRVFYALERLYGDCPVVDLQLAAAIPPPRPSTKLLRLTLSPAKAQEWRLLNDGCHAPGHSSCSPPALAGGLFFGDTDARPGMRRDASKGKLTFRLDDVGTLQARRAAALLAGKLVSAGERSGPVRIVSSDLARAPVHGAGTWPADRREVVGGQTAARNLWWGLGGPDVRGNQQRLPGGDPPVAARRAGHPCRWGRDPRGGGRAHGRGHPGCRLIPARGGTLVVATHGGATRVALAKILGLPEAPVANLVRAVQLPLVPRGSIGRQPPARGIGALAVA